MKATYYFNKNNRIQKKLNKPKNFYLANKLGDYLWLGNLPVSRYQGWCFAPQELTGETAIKVIENIELPNFKNKKIKSITNNLSTIKREREKIKEEFLLSPHFNVLSYKLSKPETVDLVFDIKDLYNNEEKQRFYKIFKEKDLLMIEYNHAPSNLLVYVAISYDSGKYEKKDEWIERKYCFDEERNSTPDCRWVYKGLRLKGVKKIFMAASFSKEQAKEEVRHVADNINKTEEIKKDYSKKIEDIISKSFWGKQKELSSAYCCAVSSLADLTINNRQKVGLYAGLPWFFQFWSRDEAISLKSLMQIKPQEAKKIFWRLLDSLDSQGSINHSSDALGWTLKRAEDFIDSKKFNKLEIKQIQEKIKRVVDLLLSQNTREDLAINKPYSTWMDTLPRDGARIEIQALRLCIYRLAKKISETIKKESYYYKLEQNLKNRIKKEFWDGYMLADGFYPEKGEADFTIRPNLFLAAYLYPKLLSRKEWINCFDEVIPKLWLNWGGFASLDKQDSNYHPCSTGEKPLSYHQGDSWYFINNLAAIVLFRLDKKKYKDYINGILKATTQDILWFNTLGSASEISSAQNCSHLGCFNQAWSAATYIELVDEMKNELLK